MQNEISWNLESTEFAAIGFVQFYHGNLTGGPIKPQVDIEVNDDHHITMNST